MEKRRKTCGCMGLKNLLKKFKKKIILCVDKLYITIYNKYCPAGMAELADAHGSGPCGSNTMRVQVPFPAAKNNLEMLSTVFQGFFLFLEIFGDYGKQKENKKIRRNKNKDKIKRKYKNRRKLILMKQFLGDAI